MEQQFWRTPSPSHLVDINRCDYQFISFQFGFARHGTTWSSKIIRVEQLISSSLFAKPALEPRMQPKTAHVVLRKPSGRIRFCTTVS